MSNEFLDNLAEVSKCMEKFKADGGMWIVSGSLEQVEWVKNILQGQTESANLWSRAVTKSVTESMAASEGCSTLIPAARHWRWWQNVKSWVEHGFRNLEKIE